MSTKSVANTPSKGAKRKTTYMLVAANSCKEKSEEEAFNAWYHSEHIGAMLSTGVFHTVTRYESSHEIKGAQPQYIIVYETDWEDPAKITKAWSEGFHKARASGAEHPNDNLVRAFPAVLYKPIFHKEVEPIPQP